GALVPHDWHAARVADSLARAGLVVDDPELEVRILVVELRPERLDDGIVRHELGPDGRKRPPQLRMLGVGDECELHRTRSATACAASPSPRPAKPRPSVVVARTATSSGSASSTSGTPSPSACASKPAPTRYSGVVSAIPPPSRDPPRTSP